MKATIPFSDFSKLELVVGTVTKAESAPNADNLLLLQVDLGDSQERQLVAGIAQTHNSEAMVGRQIVVVANLEGKEIRGYKSEGMLLAADEDGAPVLLSPEKEVPSGTRVR